MFRVLRLSAAASLALAVTVMGASAAGAATHHKPGNCSVKKKKVVAGNYHEVAVKVVCTAHGAVHSVVSHNGDVTIVRGSGRSVVISRTEVSGGGNISQVNQASGTSDSSQVNQVSQVNQASGTSDSTQVNEVSGGGS